MYYKKEETYDFRMPEEYSWYLTFRDELIASGVKFIDHGTGMFQTITINASGKFSRDDGDKLQAVSGR